MWSTSISWQFFAGRQIGAYVIGMLLVGVAVVSVANSRPADSLLVSTLEDALNSAPLPTSVAVIDLQDVSRHVVERSSGLDERSLLVQPASSVKPLLAFIAAQHGVLVPDFSATCTREAHPHFPCFAEHGAIQLVASLGNSCNTFSYELAVQLGTARIAEGFLTFGLLPADTVLPNDDFSAFSYGTGHLGNHQTTTHLCLAYSRLLDSLMNPGSLVPEMLRQDILQGMRYTVVGRDGSGKQANSIRVSIAGKTGTADHANHQVDNTSTWFVGYAPADHPRYVVAVMVLGGKNGGESAAPIARRVLEHLLQ